LLLLNLFENVYVNYHGERTLCMLKQLLGKFYNVADIFIEISSRDCMHMGNPLISFVNKVCDDF